MTRSRRYALNDNLSLQRLNPTSEPQKVIVIDNLLKHPEFLIEFALTNNFKPYPGQQDGKGYPGIRLTPPNEYSQVITDFIKPLIIKEFGAPANLDMRKSECAISLTTTKPENLGALQCVPHFDTSDTNQFAVLLYLCDETHGGTGFYRHNATALEYVTPQTSAYYLNTFFAEINEHPPEKKYFSDSDKRFTKIGLLPAAMNRMVIYRSCVLHSAYINPEKSINANPRTGRLTVNTFVAF